MSSLNNNKSIHIPVLLDPMLAHLNPQKDGIYVVDLADKTKRQRKKKSKTTNTRGVGVDEMSNMTRQLSSLIRANIPLVDSLGACSDQMDNPLLKEVLAWTNGQPFLTQKHCMLHRVFQRFEL